MFGILKRWRERRRLRRRNIFTCTINGRLKAIDPWRCYRALLAHPLFVELDSDDACQRAADGEEPYCTNVLVALCDSFGLERMDDTGRGMTDEEIFAFFADMHEYMEDLKKKRSRGLTSPSAMESEYSAAGAAHDSTTNSPLDSGSCSPEPATAAPETY